MNDALADGLIQLATDCTNGAGRSLCVASCDRRTGITHVGTKLAFHSPIALGALGIGDIALHLGLDICHGFSFDLGVHGWREVQRGACATASSNTNLRILAAPIGPEYSGRGGAVVGGVVGVVVRGAVGWWEELQEERRRRGGSGLGGEWRGWGVPVRGCGSRWWRSGSAGVATVIAPGWEELLGWLFEERWGRGGSYGRSDTAVMAGVVAGFSSSRSVRVGLVRLE